ncbi:MAG: hypothetical protein K2X93_28770 [Candidatus Obscuribacterales bacterium]|nr:hypothetical protein [Candidatus Obscuribacterales bacterium]
MVNQNAVRFQPNDNNHDLAAEKLYSAVHQLQSTGDGLVKLKPILIAISQATYR